MLLSLIHTKKNDMPSAPAQQSQAVTCQATGITTLCLEARDAITEMISFAFWGQMEPQTLLRSKTTVTGVNNQLLASDAGL